MSFETYLSDINPNMGFGGPGGWSAMFPTSGFDFTLAHHSKTDYQGPMGSSWSHSFNMYIVQDGDSTGRVVTPDMRVFDITHDNGDIWHHPTGSYSELRRDDTLNRWILTHHNGQVLQFVVGQLGMPGHLIMISEPNGNQTHFDLDFSGFLQTVTTDHGQDIDFAYDANERLKTVTDHIGRAWTFNYDMDGNVDSVVTPVTDFADIGSGVLVTDENLGVYFVTDSTRTLSIGYSDPNYPNHITSMTDQRSATPIEYTYYAPSDSFPGRVKTKRINGVDVKFFYEGQSDTIPGPSFLAHLDSIGGNNTYTRVIDREGNILDIEMHGSNGNPNLFGAGAYGTRREIRWTETGVGNSPLRSGILPSGLPEEPNYWEQRWVQNCGCLAPIAVTQPFRDDDPNIIDFDPAGIPYVGVDTSYIYYPTEFYEYNTDPVARLRRQVTQYKYEGFRLDGGTPLRETIKWEATYQDFDPAMNPYSRLLTHTPPRGTDAETNGINSGLVFTHTYFYNALGNLRFHFFPDVTRGALQGTISEEWQYNSQGQVELYIDENGNHTEYEYHIGPSSGGDINSQGQFDGYIKRVTVGASGSTSGDPVTALTTTFLVNALGMVTSSTDPQGYVYETEYNDLKEVVLSTEPSVTLPAGGPVSYTTSFIYDGAGNTVLSRRMNRDFDNSTPLNDFIDASTAYNDVNNVIRTNAEVDEDPANDLATDYAYDRNDQLSAVQYPEGNRLFNIYDERSLQLKQFHGIAPGDSITEDYPTDKRAIDLGTADFVGYSASTYDARYNTIRSRDGRGNFIYQIPDFYNRTLAVSDQNGNGTVYEYDDDSLLLTTQGGAVDSTSGELTTILERTYQRYDERGRRYQTALDIDLVTDESGDIDPDDGANPSYLADFDPGSRVIASYDANGNPSSYIYDAANRTKRITDALSNEVTYTYDNNSNPTLILEHEVLDIGGGDEYYFTTHAYDELNRCIETHVRGQSLFIDHVTKYRYDSLNYTRQVIDAEGLSTMETPVNQRTSPTPTRPMPWAVRLHATATTIWTAWSSPSTRTPTIPSRTSGE
jgi:YD repeat-containing protein